MSETGTRQPSSPLEAVVDTKAVAALRERLLKTSPPLPPCSLAYCSDHTLRRYLTKFNSETNGKIQRSVDEAEEMLRATLAWRAETLDNRDMAVSPPMINDPNGCNFINIGKDKEGRPIIYGCPARGTSGTTVDEIMLHIAMGLERALNPTGETAQPFKSEWIWVVDCHGFATKHVTLGIPLAMKMANIFKLHFREQLHAIYLIDPPKVFDTLMKVVSTFATNQTLSKISSVHGFEEYTLLLYKLLPNTDTIGRNWLLVVYSMDPIPGSMPPLPKGWNPHFGRDVHNRDPISSSANSTAEGAPAVTPCGAIDKF